MDFCSGTNLKQFRQSTLHHPTKSDFPKQPVLRLQNSDNPPETHWYETMTFWFPAKIPSQCHPSPETPHLIHLLLYQAVTLARTRYDPQRPHLPARTLPVLPPVQRHILCSKVPHQPRSQRLALLPKSASGFSFESFSDNQFLMIFWNQPFVHHLSQIHLRHSSVLASHDIIFGSFRMFSNVVPPPDYSHHLSVHPHKMEADLAQFHTSDHFS